MSPRVRRILHGGGTLLAIAGIGFVMLRLRNQAAAIDFSHFDRMVWLAMAGLTVIYGLANLLLALAWRSLLEWFGIHPGWRWTIRTYGISQIAKYLPGNILHLAGRQALGVAAGLPGWPLARSVAWELGLLALAGALFGALALPQLLTEIPILAGLVFFLLAFGGITILLWRIAGPPVACALGAYTIFLTTSGLLFVALIRLVDAQVDPVGILWLPVIGAYVLAWLAGLVTPGAPAGVGVRELVLLALLHGAVGQTELLLAVVLGRLVTVGGDLVFLGMAVAIGGRNVPAV